MRHTHASQQTPKCKRHLAEIIAPDAARGAHIGHKCLVKRMGLRGHNSAPFLALKDLAVARSSLWLRLVAVVRTHVVLLKVSYRSILFLAEILQSSVFAFHHLQLHQHIQQF
uniref:Uncharacterized protein n=1 Tax=Leishmania guyanensis TaxID=5670 RepID=A0A1E1IUH9_LEIGU|nr:Hypothetical protein BN36_2024130 [Leishmania guyanensis]